MEKILLRRKWFSRSLHPDKPLAQMSADIAGYPYTFNLVPWQYSVSVDIQARLAVIAGIPRRASQAEIFDPG